MTVGRNLLAGVLSMAVMAAGCSATTPSADDEVERTTTTPAPSDQPVAAPDPTGDAPEPVQPESSDTSVTDDGGSPAPSCQLPEPGIHHFDTNAGGPTIEVRVLIPSAETGEALPAVLDFHGLRSNGTQQAILSGYEKLARAEGFVAVHPTGAPSVFGRARAWELAQFDDPDRDDLAMVDELIARLVDDFCVDRRRIYSTGMSNGGFFTARLVCERADVIAAAVSVAGTSHPEDCHPSRPVPYLAYHGTDDQIVPFDGGHSTLERGGPSGEAARAFFAQSMPTEFAEFAADFDCHPEPEISEGDEIVRHDFVGCAEGVPLSFTAIEGGGHTWPNSAIGPFLDRALGPTTREVDATVDGWAFMSRFSLPDR